MNCSAPNLRHLRAFVSVARNQSVSKASKAIFLSQPAITQALAKLEGELDVRLFDRRTDGMYLTESGGLFCERVERMLDRIETGVKECQSVGGRKKTQGVQNLEQQITGVQVRALLALTETENFSLAARNMGVSQPSLHRAARDLEHMSGVVLFEKARRGIRLTKAAGALAYHCRLAIAELRQGIDEIEEWKGNDSGSIVIGSLPLSRSFLLPTAINALTRAKNDVQIHVIDGPYEDMLNGLRHGSIDVLIGALRDPIPVEDIVQLPLFDDPLAIVARVGHPLSLRSQITVQDLAQYTWVVPRKGAPTRDYFDDMFDGVECEPPGIIESSSLILIRNLLMASDRLTIISLHQIRHEKQMGILAPLAFDTSHTTRSIGLTTRKDWRPTATQARFIKLLKDAGQVVHSS